MGKYKVKVVPTLCIGSASCVALDPVTFQLNDQNVAEVVGDSSDDAAKLSAAKACPVSAIEVYEVDENGAEKKIWPPTGS